jgi:predicted peptidase
MIDPLKQKSEIKTNSSVNIIKEDLSKEKNTQKAIEQLDKLRSDTFTNKSNIRSTDTVGIKNDEDSYSFALRMTNPEVYISEKSGESINYRLYKPENIENNKKYPLIIFLHGAGERESDNKSQLRWCVGEIIDHMQKNNEPSYVIAPQCPKKEQWVNIPRTYTQREITPEPSKSVRLTKELIDKFKEENPVDEKRIYIVGLSMGGFGAFDLLERNPGDFTAAATFCSSGDPSYAKQLSDTPIWMFMGSKDTVVPLYRVREMAEALKKEGNIMKYTEYPEIGHDVWTAAINNPELLKWLLEQKKNH